MRAPFFALAVCGLPCSALLVHAAAPELTLTRISEAELPAGMKVVGTLASAVRYRDRAGDHVALFSRQVDSERGNARLQVDLWAGQGPKGKIVRTVKDGVARCEFDLYADFIDEALSLTDLDNDGLAELSFAYRMACTSDVSPFTLKLLLVEQRDKYVLRGSTRVDTGGGELVGGESKPDAALAKKKPFLEHAVNVWQKIVGLSPWT